MKLLWLSMTLVVVAACSSSPGVEANPDSGVSEYARTLPATDMGASRGSEVTELIATSQLEYAREFVLEEEVIESVSADAVEPYLGESGQVAGLIDIANTFTLQLAAVSSMDSAIEYARKYDIDPAKAGVARILTNGDIYYVLAYGVYASHEAAEQASLEIQAIGVPEPWIRRLSSLEQLSVDADNSGF